MHPSVDRARFFAAFRRTLGRLRPEQVAAFEDILAFLEADANVSSTATAAYMLATFYWETARTMRPIDEYGTASRFNKLYGPQSRVGKRLGNTEEGDGDRYHGRGLVQLTGRANYVRAGRIVGVDLGQNPERAKEPTVAYAVASAGMREGWFTSKKLGDYIRGAHVDYVNARRIINGTDHAADIAALAEDFREVLDEATSTPSAGTAAADDAPATSLPGLGSLGASVAGADLPSVAGVAGGAPDAGPLVGAMGDAASGAFAGPVVPTPTSATDVAPAETPKQPTIADRLTTSTTFLQSTGIQVTSIVAGVGAFFAWPGAPWVMLALLAFGVVAYVVYQWGESRRKANEATAQTAIRVAEAAASAKIEEARKHLPSEDQVRALRAQWEAELIIKNAN